MKLAVRTINLLGLIFWLGFLGLISSMFGFPNRLHFSTFLVLMPFPYFLICIVTSYTRHQSSKLLTIGIMANAIAAIASIAALREGSYWPFFLFIFYATTWFSMYFKLPKAANLKAQIKLT